MSQLGNLITVQSDKDDHFTGTIAQDAEERENFVLPQALGSANFKRSRSRLKSLHIASVQNLAWEIDFYGRDSFGTEADLDKMSFIARWGFQAADGLRIGGTGPYLYYIDGLDIPYEDADETGELHVSLVNRSVTAKLAGATGEVVVAFVFDPLAAS